ncbi:flagellar hook-basal body protein [Ramlibacter sp. WS9]|uniref:flagellar hook-basal body protein n=1 Tax=Ramlibacter sp. WS9 TaxID=1882741 RepID=UPI001141DA41|nr:flagellar hook-basal body protein [Ramlibacter sp. WS9]ROZ63183.1 flagellar hook-basal body protein [Ramlibacter sp. WS9]
MSEVLAIALHSMQGDMARVEQIGMNMANALTPGYKRGIAMQAPQGASFAAHLTQAAAVTEGAGTTAPLVEFATDARSGTLKSTGQSLDLALAGKGHFEVLTDAGPAYTRGGSFRLDARGRLVTAQGYPVMGAGGEIVLNVSNPSIAANGGVTSANGDGALVAQLKVVEFDGNARLQPKGDGLVAAGPGMKLVADDEVQVRQGFLENSNVSSTYEMTTLVHAMRHFESMQKVAQGYDDMLGTAIRKLGETS